MRKLIETRPARLTKRIWKYLERASWNLLVAEVDVGVVDARLCRRKPDLEGVVRHRFSRDGNVMTSRISNRQTDVAYSHIRRDFSFYTVVH